MTQMPLAPGAYMSSLDNRIWLLENGYWRMPGGFLARPSAFVNGKLAEIAEQHKPFRRMVPVKRKVTS